jgi:nitrogenase molybdenum-iron protein NifN
MGQSLCSFAIGVSLSRAASLLAQRCRGEVIALPHLMTLERCDRLFINWRKFPGAPFPPGLSASAANCRMR